MTAYSPPPELLQAVYAAADQLGRRLAAAGLVEGLPRPDLPSARVSRLLLPQWGLELGAALAGLVGPPREVSPGVNVVASLHTAGWADSYGLMEALMQLGDVYAALARLWGLTGVEPGGRYVCTTAEGAALLPGGSLQPGVALLTIPKEGPPPLPGDLYDCLTRCTEVIGAALASYQGPAPTDTGRERESARRLLDELARVRDALDITPPRGLRPLLAKVWALAVWVREWPGDPAPVLPEVIPDRAAGRDLLAQLVAWVRRALARLDNHPPPPGDPPPEADPYAGLRDFARKNLKGNQRALVEAVCDGGGRVPLSDLQLLFGWEDAGGYGRLQQHVNGKLRGRQPWKLRRQGNEAALEAMGQK